MLGSLEPGVPQEHAGATHILVRAGRVGVLGAALDSRPTTGPALQPGPDLCSCPQPRLSLENSVTTRFGDPGNVRVTVQAACGTSVLQDSRVVRVLGESPPQGWAAQHPLLGSLTVGGQEMCPLCPGHLGSPSWAEGWQTRL